MGAGTYLLRLSFLAKSEPRYPEAMARALRYVPVTVLAALIAPKILLVDQQFTVLDNPYLLPALVAAVVAYFTKNLGLTIGAGLTLYWTLGWLLP